MNNTVTFLGLASINLFTFTANLPANANIPQTSIQEILIEGELNQVNQQLNQSLNLNFIYLPQIEESVIPTFNIQGTFLENTNNQVDQAIEQNILDFELAETSLGDFNINDFLNSDNILDGVQFISQEVLIEGESNLIIQESSQVITDFVGLDKSFDITEYEDFSQFINKLLFDQELDSLQFGLQDTLIFGNNNMVDQTIDQTLNSFIFTDNNLSFNTKFFNKEIALDPVQFTIQETFIDSGTSNLVSQTINQVISDISFFDFASIFVPEQPLFQPNNSSTLATSNLVNFDIDAFINGILNSTIIEANQINTQQIQIIGDENIETQNNVQVAIVSVPEPSSPRIMIVLSVMIGVISYFKRPIICRK